MSAKKSPKLPPNVPRMHLAKSGETVVLGPVTAVLPGIVEVTLPSGIKAPLTVYRVGKSFPRNGTDHCYGYLSQLPALAPHCRVCKGPHRPHAARGIAAPLPAPEASRVA